MKETEIRALIEDTSPAQNALREAGFSEEKPFTQLDIMLDRPDASLFRSGQKIRIRIEGGVGELTYKGHFEGDSTASRRCEINVPIDPSNVDTWISIFTAIGYPECFRIPKTRHVFRSSNLKVTFDEWPIIGCLVEIEGEEGACKELASEIAPDTEFKSFRLKELFRRKEVDTGLSLTQLKNKYEQASGVVLGKLELLLD